MGILFIKSVFYEVCLSKIRRQYEKDISGYLFGNGTCPWSFAVEVTANIGYHTIIYTTDKDGKGVFAVEPGDRTVYWRHKIQKAGAYKWNNTQIEIKSGLELKNSELVGVGTDGKSYKFVLNNPGQPGGKWVRD